MGAEDVTAIAADAAGLLERAAADLRTAVDVLRLARSVTTWESPAGDLAREELRRRESVLLGLGEETVAAAGTVRAVAARGEG